MKRMLQELDFHLPVIRSFAFKVLQRQGKVLLRNSLFLKATHAEDLALLLCRTLLKANVGNQRLFPGLVVLFSPSTLRCLLSFSFFLSFFFFLFNFSSYLQAIVLTPLRLLLSRSFLFASCLLSPGYYHLFFFSSFWPFLKGWFGNITYWQGRTHSWMIYSPWQAFSLSSHPERRFSCFREGKGCLAALPWRIMN